MLSYIIGGWSVLPLEIVLEVNVKSYPSDERYSLSRLSIVELVSSCFDFDFSEGAFVY